MKIILFVCLALLASPTLSHAQIVYVDAAQADNDGDGTSWATAKKELQSAITQATTGQQVWVKAGTYKPATDGNRNSSFSMKSDVEIYGGFLGTETQLSQRNEIYNLTILSGDLNGDDGADFANNSENSYHLIYNSAITNTAVLDGFTITAGNSDLNSGAGMYNDASSPTIKNSLFIGNYSGRSGGGMCNTGAGSSPVITNCVFYKNKAGSGAAICNAVSASAVVSNSIITGNLSSSGGAINVDNAAITILNSTIASNLSFAYQSTLGGIFGSFSDLTIQNCVFNDNAAGRFPVTLLPVQDIRADLSSVSISFFMSGDPTPGRGKIGNSFSSPAFVDPTDPDGPDNLWRTADDGLRLQCSSPAINTGSTINCFVTIPTTDILGLPRTGNPDIGAYEGGFADQAVNSIASASTTVLFEQNATGTTNYATCDKLVASLSSSDAYTVVGSVTSRVWIETTQPAKYVKRHYEITPGINPSTATGKVTLYFTQQEFDDFNAANSTKLPTGSSDTEGIGNLRIEKRPGTSSDGTGLPNTYTDTSPYTFKPGDKNGTVTWNGTASRWEVSFEVTGFSGFFVKTAEASLPLRLMGFSGTQETATNKLQWQTADEVNTQSFELESSKDGRNFQKVAIIEAVSTGNNSYDYTDATAYKGILYYRLKMIDLDGTFSYSRILSLSRDGKGTMNLYPNPVADLLNLSLDGSLINSTASLYDTSGKLLQTIRIASAEELVNVKNLSSGAYIIKFKDGSTGSFVKK